MVGDLYFICTDFFCFPIPQGSKYIDKDYSWLYMVKKENLTPWLRKAALSLGRAWRPPQISWLTFLIDTREVFFNLFRHLSYTKTSISLLNSSRCGCWLFIASSAITKLRFMCTMLHIHSPLPSLSSADPLAALTTFLGSCSAPTGDSLSAGDGICCCGSPGGAEPCCFPTALKGHSRTSPESFSSCCNQPGDPGKAGPAGRSCGVSADTTGCLKHARHPLPLRSTPNRLQPPAS